MRAGSLAALFALGALAFAAPAGADEPPAPASRAANDAAPSWAYDLAQELMSPFCPGRSLADCPSQDAASLRMWILVQAAAGRTRADVEDELYARYGEVIRARPKAEGFGTAAYLIPVAVFAGGGALVLWFLRRATRRAAEQPTPATPKLDPELERRLDEALSR
jgi:cytochrome c-type biogenesis protein CcmH